ncbi:hypothetical protein KI688_006955 [Linnemannia hyalina]|uniref:HCP-like protein n=1 Tax=Linnemannia hyalina TaxID=64524 RepID=A0A9P7XJP6_9FUNG|nr:hypothetical protein KI688_006955 [Linnemannia hyalina]
MLHKDYPQENIRALRSVDKSIHPNSIPLASPEEIYHVETQVDPDTQKDVVLWDDILQAFENAVQVRHKIKVVPFLKGKDLRILEPRRIAAVPNIVLDVVVNTPMTESVGVASSQARQLELQPVPLQDGSAIKVEVATSTPSATSTSIAVTAASTPIATSSSNAASTATSFVRRNPVYSLVKAAMGNYTHIDRPLAFPSARGPHAVQDDKPPTIKDPVVPPHSVNSSNSQLQGPQSVITNAPMERDVVQMSISASHGDKDAQVALGDMYKDGKGVAQDYQSAMDWYLKAVEQGDAAGQQRVGVLYDEGFGVRRTIRQPWIGTSRRPIKDTPPHNTTSASLTSAMEWYVKAAKQEHDVAQCNIGALYLHGQGVLQDYTKAAEWFSKAADQGHTGAKRLVEALQRLASVMNKKIIIMK